MNVRQTLAALFAVLLVVGAAAPATVAAAEHDDVEIAVTQSPETGDATVTVTDGGAAVDGATLVVESDDDPYAGNGTYETDANGSVELPNPESEVEVDLTVVVDGNATTESVELVPLAESLDVEAEQADDGTVTVTVTQYDAAVEDATVVVADDDENETVYADEGTYETDANGTVTLDAPANETTVDVTATSGDLSAETSLDLEVPEPPGLEVDVEESDDGVLVTVTDNDTVVEGATVTVDADGDYTDEGTFETDANGTVSLGPADENETVALEITAEHDGETATTSLTLGEEAAEAPASFGQRVSQFVHELLGDEDREGGIGQAVSEWVREHNPGKAKGPGDKAGGPPAHAGASEKGNQSKSGNGNDEAPGNGNGNGNDGAPGDADGDADDEADDGDEKPGKSGDKPGKGNGNGNGNGNALVDVLTVLF
jgi:hypothetical protein